MPISQNKIETSEERMIYIESDGNININYITICKTIKNAERYIANFKKNI